MADTLQDSTRWRALIQLYIDGSNGDVAKLKKAFHADARMFGHIGPMNTYIPIGGFFDMVQAQPGMAGPKYKAFVRSIDLSGDARVAVLVETTTWAATSSTTSRWRALAGAGRSPTRPTPHRRAAAVEVMSFAAARRSQANVASPLCLDPAGAGWRSPPLEALSSAPATIICAGTGLRT